MKLWIIILSVVLVCSAQASNPRTRGLAEDIGLNTETGEVNNPTKKAFEFSIDSFGAWVDKADTIKLGLSPVLGAKGKWSLNVDFADNLAGGSLNYTLIPIIRLKVGAGYGILMGSDGRHAQELGKSRDTWFAKGSIRLW